MTFYHTCYNNSKEKEKNEGGGNLLKGNRIHSVFLHYTIFN